MTRKAVLIAIAILAVLASLAAIFFRQQSPQETASETVEVEAVATGEDAAAGETLAMDLFFPGTGGWLLAERREIAASAESVDRITAVVESLLAGPTGSGMRAPLPDAANVRKIYLAENGLAYLDFESPENTPPASGSQREMLTVYSLVNTVLLNFEQLDGVVLLWNGRQLKTFAGHVDTMRPLAANPDLIARDVGRDSDATS